MQQDHPSTPDGDRPRIQHSTGGLGTPLGSSSEPIEVSPEPPPQNTSKITMLGEKKRHEDNWTRTPNTTGGGAIHVKTFHSKLTDDALIYMDNTINEWLDAHPQYEVKFVNSTVGTLTGKLKEPHLICQVWV